MPTPEHPFWVAGKWRAASELRQGDSLWLYNGQQIAIDSVVRIVVRVYNFEVANNHTYFVGELGVGVHNDCVVVEYLLSNFVEKKQTFTWVNSGPLVKHLGDIGKGYKMLEEEIKKDSTLMDKKINDIVSELSADLKKELTESNFFIQYKTLSYQEVTNLYNSYLQLWKSEKSQRDSILNYISKNDPMVSSFAIWATYSTKKTLPPLADLKLNCWELVLLGAYLAGELDWKKIHEIYTNDRLGYEFSVDPSSAFQADFTKKLGLKSSSINFYRPVDMVEGKMVRRKISGGNIILFAKGRMFLKHVAIATGRQADDESPEVITFPSAPVEFGDRVPVALLSLKKLGQLFGGARAMYKIPKWK
ncbi:polymorphic toxin-type HINT domain-containing protein [Microscilla marina]|uniref:Uncharacterized protein n=1 Tax=Microscilla marina ATCC 23134 TaxID=313606 RepID=A1ZPS3_MICM2|nr:polymorphic toxin-type HINT domain-containing protein [Microscilla marina]EAY27578.1 hypothetical protein M23134_02825 [Microscilla marina ATCC 23134]